MLAVQRGLQIQFGYCGWYGSSHDTDFDISERAGPGTGHPSSMDEDARFAVSSQIEQLQRGDYAPLA